MLTKLQKADKDTNKLIDEYKDFLFSIGIRTSRERAWEIFQQAHKLPYTMLIKANPEISYQGAGRHITHSQGNQLLVIKNIGKFEIKGVSDKKDNEKSAAIKFIPSNDVKAMLEEVRVVDKTKEKE